MRNSTKGYYTVEAAMLLPLVLLMILALGYVTRAEGIWENAFHCAADESSRAAAMAYDGVSGQTAPARIRHRLAEDAEGVAGFEVKSFRMAASGGVDKANASYTLQVRTGLHLPAGFGRTLAFTGKVKYRNFVGSHYGGSPLGTEGLENGLPEDPVWIFPLSGEKYHSKGCSYVKASAHSRILNAQVRASYESCSACHSGELPTGSIVWCFEGERTAYHRSTCRTIDRHTTVIDRTEAIEKGYTPCSKCGGG